MKIIKKQRGMSLLAMTALGMLVAMVALVFIKLFPIYMENGQIQSVLTGVVEKSPDGEISVKKVRESIKRRFIIEGIRDISPDQVEIIVDKDGLALYIEYEARTPLFGNVELLVFFQESAESGSK